MFNNKDSHKRVFFVVIMAIVSMLIIFTQIKAVSLGNVTIVDQVIAFFFTPAQNIIHKGEVSTIGFFNGLFNFRKIFKENIELKNENEKLNEEIIKLTSYEDENERLKKILELYNLENDNKSLVCEVIGHSPENWYETVLINKGTSDGIENEMYAFNSIGLIGKVERTTLFSAHLKLITNSNVSVPACISKTGYQGIVTGSGDNKLIMKYVDNQAQIKEGDIVVSSGMGEIYPKGLLIGKISKFIESSNTMYKVIEVNPSFDINMLQFVIVSKKKVKL